MKRSFPVIDADGHVLERDRELREFLPAEFRAVPGKREYPLFSGMAGRGGAVSPHKREHPDVKPFNVPSSMFKVRASRILSFEGSDRTKKIVPFVQNRLLNFRRIELKGNRCGC